VPVVSDTDLGNLTEFFRALKRAWNDSRETISPLDALTEMRELADDYNGGRNRLFYGLYGSDYEGEKARKATKKRAYKTSQTLAFTKLQ